MQLNVFRGKHIMIVRILLSGGCATNLFFLQIRKSKSVPKIRRLELPNLPKFPIELGFPRILKLQNIENELKVITNYEITKCNILLQIFVQKILVFE